MHLMAREKWEENAAFEELKLGGNGDSVRALEEAERKKGEGWVRLTCGPRV